MKRRSYLSVRPGDQARSMSDPLPGVLRRRGEVPVPSGYAVFDCETSGTDPDVDEIVSLFSGGGRSCE